MGAFLTRLIFLTSPVLLISLLQLLRDRVVLVGSLVLLDALSSFLLNNLLVLFMQENSDSIAGMPHEHLKQFLGIPLFYKP